MMGKTDDTLKALKNMLLHIIGRDTVARSRAREAYNVGCASTELLEKMSRCDGRIEIAEAVIRRMEEMEASDDGEGE